jgi:hypothetical protein
MLSTYTYTRFSDIGVMPHWRSRQSLPVSPHPSLAAHASASDTYIEILHKAASGWRHKGVEIAMQEEIRTESITNAISSACTDMDSLSPSHLSTLLWSICRLGLNASSDESLLKSCREIATLTVNRDLLSDHDTTSSDLVTMVWSMSRLKTLVSPPSCFKSWLKKAIGIISSRAHELTPSHITSLVASLVVAKEPVSPSFCNLLGLCCASKLEEMTPSELSAVISGLGKLRAPLNYKVLIVILDHYRTILPQVTSPEELSSVVFALTGLCYPNLDTLKKRRKNFLQDLARHSLPLIPQCSPRQLVLLVSGFTRLGFYPGVEWMRLHRQCCVDKRLDFDERTRNRVIAAYQALLLT